MAYFNVSEHILLKIEKKREKPESVSVPSFELATSSKRRSGADHYRATSRL